MALAIAVIIGSTREGRFSDKAAAWIAHELRKLPDVDVSLVDLRDHPLPFFDAPTAPMRMGGVYPHASVQTFAELVAKADAFVMVAPEYNHGYTAVLKNAIDWLYGEWINKPVGFVSYGNAGGARAVEQLRQVAVEMQMLPIKAGLHIPAEAYMAARQAPAPLDPEILSKPARARIDRIGPFCNELVNLGRVMQAARAEKHV
jgi:NAD(P)H-dependent FMN reductase